VYINNGTFNMSSGMVSGNKASNGSGVFVAGSFRIGGTAKIYGNTMTDDESSNNVFAGRNIVLGNGTPTTGNVPVPAETMNIHVITARGVGIFANGAKASDVQFFTADNGNTIGFLSGQLFIIDSAEAAEFYEKVASYADAEGDMIITVDADLDLPIPVMVPANENYTLTIKSTDTKTITRSNNENGSIGFFIVSSGVKLIFENITIDGNYRNSTGEINTSCQSQLVSVINGGEFTLKAGAVLKNNGISWSNSNSGIKCGGVYIEGTNSTFILDGGEVSGNVAGSTAGSKGDGGGVYIDNNGTFIMNGGKVSDNTANSYNGGGVYIGSNGTFIMNAGEVSRNYAYLGGGGVYIGSNGTFIMNAGEVFGNEASNSSYQNPSSGGGVCITLNGTFYISNGTVYGSDEEALSNTASSGAAFFLNGNSTNIIAQYGIFDNDTWERSGDINTTNNTIEVINGELIHP